MNKRVILSVGLAIAILTGCGSSSGGETQTGTGYYIDSAISGVDYVCGSKKGKTGTDGSFTFEKGKSCTFSLGDMKLREVKADKLKDQIKVLEDNLAVATLLQTLDSDGNPDNEGIVISAKIIEELKAKNITKLPTNQDEVTVIYEVIKNVDGYKGVLKTEAQAQAHLDSGSKVSYTVYGGDEYFSGDLDEMKNYTLLGKGYGIETFYGDYKYYAIVNKGNSSPIQIDSVLGSDGVYYGTGTTSLTFTSSGDTWSYLDGEPDNKYVSIGREGYILISANEDKLTSIKVFGKE